MTSSSPHILKGASFWFKARDSRWRPSVIKIVASQSTLYTVRFSDDPDPVELQLLDQPYSTDLAAPPISWYLQRYVKRGVQHNANDREVAVPNNAEDSSD